MDFKSRNPTEAPASTYKAHAKLWHHWQRSYGKYSEDASSLLLLCSSHLSCWQFYYHWQLFLASLGFFAVVVPAVAVALTTRCYTVRVSPPKCYRHYSVVVLVITAFWHHSSSISQLGPLMSFRYHCRNWPKFIETASNGVVVSTDVARARPRPRALALKA